MKLFIFRPTSGTPTLIAQVEVQGAQVFCDDGELREWLQDGVDQLIEEIGLPRTEEEQSVFLDMLCKLRSNARLFCSKSPLGT